MRRAMPLLLSLMALVFLAGGVEAQSALKIGYIDSQAILDQDPAAQAANAQFQEALTRYRAEVQQLGEELQVLVDEYERQQNTLSPAARTNREEQIRMKNAEYEQRLSEIDQQAQVRQAELIQPVMDRITTVIEALREEGSYSLIFDVAAQGIISADPSLDLTQEVIRRLTAMTPPGGGL